MPNDEVTTIREAAIRDYYAACGRQDWSAIKSFLHPDVVFQVAGNEPTRSVDVLQQRVSKAMESAEVTVMTMQADRIIHEPAGQRCVAEIRVVLRRKDGRHYEGPGSAIFHFDDTGMIDSYHAFTDEGDFWA